ncbi:MAG: tRNA pseudouridine(55) synthase TruB [Xanthobacteraceae bacterium]|nr:tRNA pseudouridine(55) synthase TruB [Xanthobacteraceae bacterium]
MSQMRSEKCDVHGWIALDKQVGQTSTAAVTAVKRLYRAKKAGHAGTLDPLASGVLPIALGEATKTVPFVMEGRKVYRFSVRWGIETDTDDADGRPLETSPDRPSPEAVRAALPNFTGTIEQVPPRFSALKIDGERAYDLAREGEEVVLSPRPVEVHRLALVDIPDSDHAVFEAECGKGTYVRALARDLGRRLGCLGHVNELRRMRVGPFEAAGSITLNELARLGESGGKEALARVLKPIEAGLDALPALSVSRAEAQRLVLGQSVLLRGRDAPLIEGLVSVSAQGALVALAEVEQGALKPRRIFNLPR